MVALLLLLGIGYAVQAAHSREHGSVPATTGSAASAASSTGISGGSVALSALPIQAQQTVARIRAGGPLPYARDGIVFVNREGVLPRQRNGYYHEYTVSTPGESDRGPRRIIAGGGGDLYYTADHYASFQRVDLLR